MQPSKSDALCSTMKSGQLNAQKTTKGPINCSNHSSKLIESHEKLDCKETPVGLMMGLSHSVA